MKTCKVCNREQPPTSFYGRRNKCKECYKQDVMNRKSKKPVIAEENSEEIEVQPIIPDLTEASLYYHRTEPKIMKAAYDAEDCTQTFPFCDYYQHKECKILTDVYWESAAKIRDLPGVSTIPREEYVRLADLKTWRRVPAWNFVRIVEGKEIPDQDRITCLCLYVNEEDLTFAIFSCFEVGYLYYKHAKEYKVRLLTSRYNKMASEAGDLIRKGYMRINRNGFPYDHGLLGQSSWTQDD